MIELKEYQKEAIKIVEDKFNLGLNRTCIIWPTGLGKTIVPIELMKNHPNQRFLIIAPKHSILKQTRGYMGEEKVSSENAMFYTYSGLSKMKEEVMKKLNPDYIVLDEMHRAGAKEWGKGVDRLLETYSEAKLLGLTATPTRMDGKNVAEEKFNGDIAHQITLEEAIARGLLKMPKSYINAIYSLNGEIGDIEKSIEKIQDKEERDNLTQKLEKVKRKLEESKGLGEILSERMSNKKGKYIIFCKDIEHMHKMQEKSEEWFKGVNETIETYSISIEKTPLQNSRELRHFKENNNESLKLLYSVEMFNEGLHIENDGIIMLRPTASWIIYLQQLGRTLGIQESGEVFDIVNNSRSSKDIYQFYEAVKRIQKREKVEGVNIDFTIYDEIREISELLEEITASIHRNKFSFEEKIEYLKELKEKGKKVSETKKRDKAEDKTPIGEWVSQWRKDYKKGKLTEEEIKKIAELGIDLEVQRRQTSIAEKIKYFEKLKEKEEDLSKIKERDKTEDGTPIGEWIKNLRKDYKKGKLTEEEIKQITELGIVLEPQKGKRLSNSEKIEYLEVLKEQGEESLEIEQVYKIKSVKKIREWVSQWRAAYRKGKLTKEEIKQITDLGIQLSLKDEEKAKNSAKIKLEEAKKLCKKYEELIGENQKFK